MYKNRIVLMAVLLIGGTLLTACGSSDDDDAAGEVNPFADYDSEQYRNNANWLCHPGLAEADNRCATNLDATIVYPDGSTELEAFVPLLDAPVDCFYVYPTVSFDAGLNSDLVPDEEIFTTVTQAARYSAVCRVFAPVYRQVTVGGIFGTEEGDFELAYADVLDAFKQYIAGDNDGRGFILLGHSQGTGHLQRLLAKEIETNDYLAQRLIAAHLIGLSIEIPKGADVGGSFQNTPVCRHVDDTACVVSFASYRDSDPLLESSFFGTTADPKTEAACTHPAALSGGSAMLDAYFSHDSIPALDTVLIERAPGGPFADADLRDSLATPFYKMPGFLVGECITTSSGANLLLISAQAEPSDPRADDFNGEFLLGPGWGLHLLELYYAMGDLVGLAASQSESWLGDRE